MYLADVFDPSSFRVLVVDDDDNVRRVLAEILAERGYRVDEARDAAEARRLCEEASTPFDCAVVDIQLPGEDGLSLLGHLQSRMSSLKAVCVSGIEPRQVDLPPGAIVLQKPFQPLTLLVYVQAVLHHRGSASPLRPRTAEVARALAAGR